MPLLLREFGASGEWDPYAGDPAAAQRRWEGLIDFISLAPLQRAHHIRSLTCSANHLANEELLIPLACLLRHAHGLISLEVGNIYDEIDFFFDAVGQGCSSLLSLRLLDVRVDITNILSRITCPLTSLSICWEGNDEVHIFRLETPQGILPFSPTLETLHLRNCIGHPSSLSDPYFPRVSTLHLDGLPFLYVHMISQAIPRAQSLIFGSAENERTYPIMPARERLRIITMTKQRLWRQLDFVSIRLTDLYNMGLVCSISRLLLTSAIEDKDVNRFVEVIASAKPMRLSISFAPTISSTTLRRVIEVIPETTKTLEISVAKWGNRYENDRTSLTVSFRQSSRALVASSNALNSASSLLRSHLRR
jgi:hypothetical protein